jgi:hypothetical protein
MSATKSPYPQPTAEHLAHLYTALELGCPDIGWLYERDAKTVHYWLRQAGIATRARGTNPGPQFKPGQRSAFAGRKHSPESIAKVRASTIADGRVPHLRNGQHWLKGAAPEMNPNWKGGATPERQEFYRSPEWKAACRAVWHRADACCDRCGFDYRTVDRKETPKFHVHHVWSFQIRETRSNPALMVLLCRPCHLFVHSNANETREFLPQEPDSTTFPTFDQVHYLKSAEKEFSMPSLFDALETEELEAA